MATKKFFYGFTPFSKLGDDVLLEVLIRLPDSRSAVRCKSVCKRWNSLISASHFSRRFVSHHRPNWSAGESEPPLLTPTWSQEPICFVFEPMAVGIRSLVLDCHKDLLLIGFEDFNELGRTYLVCNPFTKQWVALPLAPPQTSPQRLTTSRLVLFEPCDSDEHRFCVVRMYESLDSAASTLDLFCSKSGEWVKVGLDLGGQLTPDWSLVYNFAVSLNGNLYWKNDRKQVVEWDPFRLEGDADSSLAATTALIDASQMDFYSSIWASEAALHMVSYEFTGELWSVWRLEEEEEEEGCSRGWKRRYEVSLKWLNLLAPVNSEILYVVGQHPWKSDILFFRRFGERHDEPITIVYNLRSEKIDSFTFDKELVQRQPCYTAFQLREILWPTLVPNYDKLRDKYDGSYSYCFPYIPQAFKLSQHR